MLRPTTHARKPSSLKDCRFGAGVSSKVKPPSGEVKEKYKILGVRLGIALGIVAYSLLFGVVCEA
jgi:hypothetical protein